MRQLLQRMFCAACREALASPEEPILLTYPLTHDRWLALRLAYSDRSSAFLTVAYSLDIYSNYQRLVETVFTDPLAIEEHLDGLLDLVEVALRSLDLAPRALALNRV